MFSRRPRVRASQFLPPGEVQGGGLFVEQHQPGLGHESPGDLHALALARREEAELLSVEVAAHGALIVGRMRRGIAELGSTHTHPRVPVRLSGAPSNLSGLRVSAGGLMIAVGAGLRRGPAMILEFEGVRGPQRRELAVRSGLWIHVASG